MALRPRAAPRRDPRAAVLEVTSPVTRFGWFIIGTLYGLRDRRAGLRANMAASLARVAALADSAQIKQKGVCVEEGP